MPLVSVIIATKNRAAFLPEAIESVLHQEYQHLELIVIDGGSTDNTEEVVQRYKNVNFIIQHNGSIAEAWNLGISVAKGELISFIDSDDIWSLLKLRIQVEYLLKHPEIQYVISKIKYFLQSGCSIPKHFRKSLLEGEYTGYLPQCLLARKRLFKSIGLFDTKYRIGNDTDWFVRAKDLSVPMAIIPEVMLHKRLHGSNVSVENISTNNRELLDLLRNSIRRNKTTLETS